MLKRFTTKELVFIALMGAMEFITAFIAGMGIIVATGLPMTGGVVGVFLVSILLVTGLLVVRKFGTAMIIVFIHMLLASPTASIGPPGVYKIVVGLVFGFIFDSALYILKYNRVSYYLGIGLGLTVLVPLLVGFLVLLGLPGGDKLTQLIFPVIIIYVTEGLLGTYLARLFYFKKLRNSRLVKLLG